ncbi:MAG: hypothetical protein ACO1N5_07815 [Noviherbaspirillum sp.]
MAYWHSVCPVCEQGRLFVTKIQDTGELFLLCEECESAWLTPEEIDVKKHFDFQGMSIHRAGREDIEHSEWIRYPLTQV